MRAVFIAAVASLAAFSQLSAQQHPHHAGMPPRDSTIGGEHADHAMMAGPLGIPETRDGSGTAWLPDASPMYAYHAMAGPWTVMLHGNAFLQYIDERSDRGDRQLGSVNWFMAMAERRAAGGQLGVRAMLSAEPLTVGTCGYPDVLATGEFCDGEPLHDRQHPHDLFMELAARYQHPIGSSLALEVYGGPVGEPVLGPVAYPHRVSAMPGPLAPIGHHWEDATHIAFGVATAGLYGRKWKLEGSAFNGREPDEDRYDFDLGALDSYAGRLWILPTDRLALQVSTGFLNDAEPGHEGGGRVDVHRTTASATYHQPLGRIGSWANTLIWGQNRAHGLSTNAALVESSLDLDERNVFFGRGEWVQKSGEDLALPEASGLGDRVFGVGKAALGYVRQFPTGGLLPGIGAQVAVNFVPSDLEPFYGGSAAAGFAIFASVRPARMRMGGMEAMAPVGAPTRAPALQHVHDPDPAP